VTAAAGAEAEVVWIKHPENMQLIFISIGFVQMLMKKRKAKSEKRKAKSEKRKAKIKGCSIHEFGHGHVTEKGEHPLGAFGVMGCV
jgi:hypothetical protein